MKSKPRNVEVTWDIEGDKAEVFFNIVDQESLVHNVNGAIRHELFKVISEGFTPEVDSFHGVVEREVLKDRGGVSEGEATVDNEATLGLGDEPARGPRSTGLVEMGQGRGVGHVEGLEVEVFEDEFVGGALDGRESEEGFGQEEGGVRRGDAEECGEEVGPYVALQVWVY